MKKINVFVALVVSAGMIFSGCSASNTAKGGVIGGASGAALGAGIGALAAKSGNKGTGAAIGAAVGTAVGATAGALIGRKMDKQKEELEKVQGAQVENVTDANGLQAIKVTFESGILFDSGKSDLKAPSKTALTNFATSLKNTPETDVTIYGYTDSQGGDKVNIPLSQQRAASVQNYLSAQGVATSRMTAVGKGSADPVAAEDAKGIQALNRRVEVYITANAQMIQQAEQGTLK